MQAMPDLPVARGSVCVCSMDGDGVEQPASDAVNRIERI